jgi:MOSC domain-containing protein YiiM
MTVVVNVFVAPERGAPMQAVSAAECVLGRGLRGDRYFDITLQRGPDQGVTLIESEHVEAFRADTGLALGDEMPRRNILTRGVRLNDLNGRRFRVGGALLEGVELAEPCRLFQRRTQREVLKFFAGKGGLRARVLETGMIAIGDAIMIVDP